MLPVDFRRLDRVLDTVWQARRTDVPSALSLGGGQCWPGKSRSAVKHRTLFPEAVEDGIMLEDLIVDSCRYVLLYEAVEGRRQNCHAGIDPSSCCHFNNLQSYRKC